ncbi:YbhB/YbcL family Raf kinase inhibitor-like protein [Microvirga roseola]|uniref:YbhB/YbcL family Raf kinase inhibitor-like protein n=1 Tax=Microvirga roseola TaxID=2883126 RepID=UPI002AC31EBB|nr:YbhB/YbcL family Raf kinase inhibitor-like protein [Microvirga roseola]
MTHSAYGENASPPLSWSGAPEGTRSFAVVVDDPDAPGDKPFTHWVAYNIPADTTSLREGCLPIRRSRCPRARSRASTAAARQGISA